MLIKVSLQRPVRETYQAWRRTTQQLEIWTPKTSILDHWEQINKGGLAFDPRLFYQVNGDKAMNCSVCSFVWENQVSDTLFLHDINVFTMITFQSNIAIHNLIYLFLPLWPSHGWFSFCQRTIIVVWLLIVLCCDALAQKRNNTFIIMDYTSLARFRPLQCHLHALGRWM